jgi:hypothetical protein
MPIARDFKGNETKTRPFLDRKDGLGSCGLFVADCMVGVAVICAAMVVAAIVMGLLYSPRIVVMMIMIERNRAH